MATETVDGDAPETDEDVSDPSDEATHQRSLIVTTTATIGGLAAGFVSSMVATGSTVGAEATDTTGLIVLAAAVVVELGFMRLLGVDVTEFSTKDQLYVIFMTFALWYVSWTILLTTA